MVRLGVLHDSNRRLFRSVVKPGLVVRRRRRHQRSFLRWALSVAQV